jgi:hypothetical protein
MPKYKIDVYLDDNYVKTVYRDADDEVEAERDALDRLEIVLDVEEID